MLIPFSITTTSLPAVICDVSRVTCRVSDVRCHVSHITQMNCRNSKLAIVAGHIVPYSHNCKQYYFDNAKIIDHPFLHSILPVVLQLQSHGMLDLMDLNPHLAEILYLKNMCISKNLRFHCNLEIWKKNIIYQVSLKICKLFPKICIFTEAYSTQRQDWAL